MRAIRAAHAFDGDRFLPGGATVLVDGGRIVGVEANRDGTPTDVPSDVEVAAYAGWHKLISHRSALGIVYGVTLLGWLSAIAVVLSS
jgi:hypothetical protein